MQDTCCPQAIRITGDRRHMGGSPFAVGKLLRPRRIFWGARREAQRCSYRQMRRGNKEGDIVHGGGLDYDRPCHAWPTLLQPFLFDSSSTLLRSLAILPIHTTARACQHRLLRHHTQRTTGQDTPVQHIRSHPFHTQITDRPPHAPLNHPAFAQACGPGSAETPSCPIAVRSAESMLGPAHSSTTDSTTSSSPR